MRRKKCDAERDPLEDLKIWEQEQEISRSQVSCYTHTVLPTSAIAVNRMICVSLGK